MQTLLTPAAFQNNLADSCRHRKGRRFICANERVGGSPFCAAHKALTERETTKAKQREATTLEGYVHFPGSQCTNIYFVRTASGPVKIGHTYNVNKRVESLQIASSERLTVLAYFVAPKIMEKRLHEALKDRWLGGEWFEFCPEIEILCRLARAGSIENIKRFVGWPTTGSKLTNPVRTTPLA